MSKLLISTQVYENYGSHDWDGEGECPSYWKAKGGNDYVVKNFKDFAKVTETVMALSSQIECDNHAFRETIINFEIVTDDHMTEYEREQLKYDGRVVYASKELVW